MGYLLILCLYLALCYIVSYWAQTYQRSKWVWFFLAFFFNPVIAFIFLLVAGIPTGAQEIKNKISEEYKPYLSEKGKRDFSEEESKCPNCGASINILIGKGVVIPDEKTPWDIRCAACGNSLSAENLKPNP